MKFLKSVIEQFFKEYGDSDTYWLPLYTRLLDLYCCILNTEYPKPYIQEYILAVNLAVSKPDDGFKNEKVEGCKRNILDKLVDIIPDIGYSSGSQDVENFVFWAIEDIHKRKADAEIFKLGQELVDLERKKQIILSKIENRVK